MYDILIAIAILIVFTIYFIIIKKKDYKLPIKIIIVVISIVFMVGLDELCFKPLEKKIVGFATVEDAVQYEYRRDRDIEPIYIKQEDSAIVLFKYETIPHLYEKENGKWRISNIHTQEMKKIYSTDMDINYNMFKIKSKSDNKVYVILEAGMNEQYIKEQVISDNISSEFNLIKREPAMKGDFYSICFYTVLDKDIEDYKLNINGRTVMFEK